MKCAIEEFKNRSLHHGNSADWLMSPLGSILLRVYVENQEVAFEWREP